MLSTVITLDRLLPTSAGLKTKNIIWPWMKTILVSQTVPRINSQVVNFLLKPLVLSLDNIECERKFKAYKLTYSIQLLP